MTPDISVNWDNVIINIDFFNDEQKYGVKFQYS